MQTEKLKKTKKRKIRKSKKHKKTKSKNKIYKNPAINLTPQVIYQLPLTINSNYGTY